MHVLIVDDHALFGDALKTLLRDQGRHRAQVARTVEEGLALAAKKPEPDLVLLDLNLPGVSGLEGLQRFRERFPDLPVALLSAHGDRLSIEQGLRMGAQGFLSKAISGAELLPQLKRLLAGEVVVQGGPPSGGPATARLTPRELEVLRGLAAGRSNKDLAADLGLSLSTVRTHLASVFKALSANSRTQAVLRAQQAGLVGAVPPSRPSLPH